ncbi:hypothetical protein [Agrobacterium sp. NPDC090273]|uniref:hypothetical protein n=1 Tax=Agrobacterium sp. NPDC090273 TaxID=3363919 RepID=UPI00383ACB20
MTFPSMSFHLLAPVAMLVGAYFLVRCIAMLARVIFPKVRVRFSAGEAPCKLTIPRPDRYVINVLIPPFTFFTGVSHFSARFSVTTFPGKVPLDYRSYGRSLFRVQRTDMAGKQSVPLGSFECTAPGEILITCDNPETIRPNYLLEVSSPVSALTLVALILATIMSSAMTIGGLIISILWISGKI